MATATALPVGTLAGFPTDFWASEGNVNGVWNGLLADAFKGTPAVGGNAFISCPEGRLDGSTARLRGDLVVRYLSPVPGVGGAVAGHELKPILQYEGKSSSGPNFEHIGGIANQMENFFKAVTNESQIFQAEPCWALGARGKKFRFYLYNGGATIWPAAFASAGGLRYPTAGAEYDITVTNDYNRVVALFLWMRTHMFPRGVVQTAT